MTQLVRYEQARFALAECQRVDEVKDIRDKAEAMAAYARQAKDTELMQWATDIKVRAERRAGEMLKTMDKSKGALLLGSDSGAGRGESFRQSQPDTAEKLSDYGISRNQSSRWQSLAGMSDEHFETAVATAKDTAGQVTTAFMLREAARTKGKALVRKPSKADQERLQQLEEAKSRGVSMLTTYARLTLTALRAQTEFTGEEKSVLKELSAALQKVSEIN